MRIHFVAALYVLYLSRFFDFSGSQYILLIILISAVIAAELFNTAIEAAVDLVSPQYSKHGKIAKDAAAGAVLVLAAGAAVAGIVMFWDAAGFVRFYNYHTNNILYAILFIVSVAAALVFIFAPTIREKDKSGEKKEK